MTLRPVLTLWLPVAVVVLIAFRPSQSPPGLELLQEGRLWPFGGATWLAPFGLGVSLLSLIASRFAVHLSTALERIAGRIRRACLHPWWAALAVAPLLWVFRCRVHTGDFGRVMFDVQHDVWLLAAEPLAPALFLAAARALAPFGVDPVAAVTAVVVAAGAAAIAGLSRLAVQATETRPACLPAALLLLVGSGTSALYFGHVETYTVSAALLIWALSIGWDGLDGASPWSRRAVSAALLSLAAAFHMAHLAGFAGLCALAWPDIRAQRRRDALALLLVGLVPAGTAELMALAFTSLGPPYPQHFGGADGSMFLSLAVQPHSLAHYTLGSTQHLMGVANILLLVCPVAVVLPGWLITAGVRSAVPVAVRPRLAMLSVVSAGWLALCLVWSPDLGSFHDWDLFASLGIPLSALTTMCLLSGPASLSPAVPLTLLGLGLVQAAPLVGLLLFNHGAWIR